jgi:hypothetical protein
MREMLMRGKIAQVADGFTPFAEWRNSRWPRVLATSLERPARWTAIVDGLIESTLLGRPKDPVLFHTGD